MIKTQVGRSSRDGGDSLTMAIHGTTLGSAARAVGLVAIGV